MVRVVVVQLWTGAQIAQRLGPDDLDPTDAELDAVATAWTATNDGVRPAVRVLEVSSLHRPLGAAGTLP